MDGGVSRIWGAQTGGKDMIDYETPIPATLAKFKQLTSV